MMCVIFSTPEMHLVTDVLTFFWSTSLAYFFFKIGTILRGQKKEKDYKKINYPTPTTNVSHFNHLKGVKLAIWNKKSP